MNDIERGDRAREVLENQVYIEAFEAIEQELIKSWKQSKSADDRESLWLEQKLLSKVQTHLLIAMQTGKLARQKQSIPQRVTELVMRTASGLS